MSPAGAYPWNTRLHFHPGWPRVDRQGGVLDQAVEGTRGGPGPRFTLVLGESCLPWCCHHAQQRGRSPWLFHVSGHVLHISFQSPSLAYCDVSPCHLFSSSGTGSFFLSVSAILHGVIFNLFALPIFLYLSNSAESMTRFL